MVAKAIIRMGEYAGSCEAADIAIAMGGHMSHLDTIRIPGHELGNSAFAGFVFGSFCRGLRRHGGLLARELERPGVTVLIATPVGDPTFVGWLAACPSENRVICAYTKAAYRASPEQRHQGVEDGFRVASTLAAEAGIDFGRPVLCSFWSRAATAIQGRNGNPYNLQRP